MADLSQVPTDQLLKMLAQHSVVQATPAAKPTQALSVNDVAQGAAKNFGPSALQFAKNIATPFLHPIDTAKAAYHVAAGTAEKLIPGKQSDEPYADAVGSMLAQRYGGLENIKRTVATDPVGALADASAIFTLGGAAVPRAAGYAGRLAEVAKYSNPIRSVVTAVKYPAKVAGKVASQSLGLSTGAGARSIETAFEAGKVGGPAADAYLTHLRGNAPMEDVVTDAQGALSQMRADRGATYLRGIGGTASDPTTLDINPILDAVNKASTVNNYKGVDLAKSTARIRQQLSDTVNQWAGFDRSEYHTAEGFDALKRSIGDIRDSTQYGTPERIMANGVYNAVKKEIVKQSPAYAETMKNYQEASDQINQIQSTLSLKNGGRTDTALRKLQSVMRDNVNTNYGARVNFAQALANKGAPQLMEKIAGQQLSSIAPRGLARILPGAEGAAALLMHNPAVLATLPLQSPRIVGEGAYYAGKGAGIAKNYSDALANSLLGVGVASPERQGRSPTSIVSLGR